MTLSILINYRAPIGRDDMKKPEHTRPLNIEHAKAGAPFAGSNGEEVKVLIWDRKHPTHPIIAIEMAGDQEAYSFRADGTREVNWSHELTSLVMLPLGTCQGKPVFVGDQLIDPTCDSWEDAYFTAGPTMRQGHLEHCKWPEPAPVYPETLMTDVEMTEIIMAGRDKHLQASVGALVGWLPWHETKLIANAAIARAIDDGQVVRAEDVNAQVIDNVIKSGGRNLVPEEMLAKVAEAASRATFNAIYSANYRVAYCDLKLDMAAIIATVKAGKA